MPKTPLPTNGETDTSPRAYAFEIIKAPTRAERAALLALVPAHLRGLVETHVRIHFARRASERIPGTRAE